MKELIKIIEHDGIETVNARDLQKIIENKTDFSTWINRRIDKYGFAENTDFIKLLKKGELSKTGQKCIEYYLTLDMAKELSMVENTEKGREIRLYFINLEKKVKSKQPIRILGRKELLLGNLELLEKNEQLQIENEDIKTKNEKQQSKIEAQKPAVELAKNLKAATNSILVRELAKMLYDSEKINIGQNRLYDWFVNKGYLMKKPKNRGYEPYQQYMKYFDLETVLVETNNGNFTKYTTKINGKGQAYFISKILKNFKDGAA